MALLCLITGGNSGIGKEVARQLLQRGHRVILACRDMTRGQSVMQELLGPSAAAGRGGTPAVELVQCDLGSLDSVRQCAEEVLGRHPLLNVLVCNAGVVMQRSVSITVLV